MVKELPNYFLKINVIKLFLKKFDIFSIYKDKPVLRIVIVFIAFFVQVHCWAVKVSVDALRFYKITRLLLKLDIT